MVSADKYVQSPLSGAYFITDWDNVFPNAPFTGARKLIVCPFCVDDRKEKNRKKKSAYIWPDEGRFKCFHCGVWGYKSKSFEGVKYEKPEPLPTNLPPEKMIDPSIVQYFAERGISQPTLQKMGIRSTEYSFPQDVTEDATGKPIFKKVISVVYPYMYKNILLFYKYRGMEKQFALSKSPKLILWNIDVLLKPTKPNEVIITEGENDGLSWIESGIDYVMSVPNGANLKNNNLDYLGRVIDLFDGVETIYLAVDGDEAGVVLREDLARRLGKHRIKIVRYPEGCKDTNDVLKMYGTAGVLNLKKNADPYPIDGVLSLSDVEDELDSLYENGREPYLKIYLSNLDDYVTWSRGNQLTALSARPNSAKSDVLFSVMLRLAIIHDMKWLVFSPETGDTRDIIELMMQIMTGRVFPHGGKNGMYATLGKEEYNYCKGLISNYFKFVDFDDLGLCTVDLFLEKVEESVKKYGINGVLADPYNHFSDGFSGDGEGGMALGLSSKLTAIKSMCKRLDVHVILVPHPAKLTGDEPMDSSYDVFGATMWANKVDNLVFLNRLYTTGMPDHDIGDNIDVRTRKIKKRWAGRRSEDGAMTLSYKISTGQTGRNGEDFQTYHDWLQKRSAIYDSDIPYLSSAVVPQNVSGGQIGGKGMLSSMLPPELLPPEPLPNGFDEDVPF